MQISLDFTMDDVKCTFFQTALQLTSDVFLSDSRYRSGHKKKLWVQSKAKKCVSRSKSKVVLHFKAYHCQRVIESRGLETFEKSDGSSA